MPERRRRKQLDAPGGRAAFTPIKGPLEELLDVLNLRDPMEGWKAVELWPALVGPRVAAHARATGFRDGVVYVEVDTAAWMNELAYLRRKMVADLNEKLGSDRVKEIRLLPTRRTGEEA